MNIEACIWKLYKGLGADVADNLPNDRLAGVLIEFCSLAQYSLADVTNRLAKVKEDRKKLKGLLALPSVAQRSQEWYDLRKERLTASDAYKALVENRTRDMLIRNKAFPETVKFINSAPCEWGKMFEPMALRMYRARNEQVLVHDFGLIPHPTLSCFGASPDGITDLGVMIEIKCPYTREIKPGYIPDYYEIQMQGQLAVCELLECDYIECKIIQHHTEEAYIQAARRVIHSEDHGIVLGSDMYVYSPPTTSAECLDWSRNTKKELNESKVVMWTLEKIQVQRVKFDADRWANMVPKFKKFWADVIETREKGIEAPPTATATAMKQKKDKVIEFLDDDDDE